MRLKKMRFAGDDVEADIREKYGYDGALLEIYARNTGPVVHKWHHYIPIYDRYFNRFRGTEARFLEIGVSKGGSLQMWRTYLGAKATLFGIDINPSCATYDGQSGAVRIGSQDDPEFLRAVVAEMGGVDVVLDDGSHEMDHIRASLAVLFPLLSDGGVYMIEDLHTAYSRNYGGGFGKRGNFFYDLPRIIDDMHHNYHNRDRRMPELEAVPSSLHVHDSIVVLEKDAAHAPVHSWVGT